VFELLSDTKIDFMRWRNVALAVSGALILAAIALIVGLGPNMGVEFSGGTELQIKYREKPDIGAIRSALAGAGMSSVAVTSIGDPAEHEVYIRLGTAAQGQEEHDPTSEAMAALRGDAARTNDLNIIDQASLQRILANAPGMSTASAATLAEAILAERKDKAIFHDPSELATIPGMTPEVQSYLDQQTDIGPLALRSQSYIGPAIGGELQRKAALAIVGSLIGMLIYIWVRFELQWGLAAVVALAHDTVITLGLFVLFRKEMSLPVVAAFLTLVGYSVNDTVVVFDRIRENLRKMAGRNLESVINLSINQTLSRTVITSGLTFVVVLALLLFGGEALNPFAFVLTVGVIVGTYSSIFIASPILVLWRQYIQRRNAGRSGSESGAPRARKVRA